MSFYVIIRGPSGVGKTTISKNLAKKLQVEVIHYDKIMKNLGFEYILGDKWIPLYKFIEADKIMIPNFQHKIGKGTNLILDGNFYHKEQIDDLIKNLDFPHVIFTLKSRLDECIKRDKTRTGEIGEQRTADVFKLVSAFDCGIIIETNNKTPADIVKEIISYLPKS